MDGCPYADFLEVRRGLVAGPAVHYVSKSSERANKTMQIRDGVVDAIGHTPLIKLERASAATGCTILGKAEFMNPGGSVKDRPGRQMILEAEKRGELKPGGLVVEGTAGNTGIGLALVANARGYRTVIVIPETQSQEKKDMLRLCGAELVEVPASVPPVPTEQMKPSILPCVSSHISGAVER